MIPGWDRPAKKRSFRVLLPDFFPEFKQPVPPSHPRKPQVAVDCDDASSLSHAKLAGPNPMRSGVSVTASAAGCVLTGLWRLEEEQTAWHLDQICAVGKLSFRVRDLVRKGSASFFLQKATDRFPKFPARLPEGLTAGLQSVFHGGVTRRRR
ncbi:MAG: hypothetical protein JWL81_546 [Verrucomicrobiales bacterium]|nr:hypothetical protein [Verrucomicrobiales bacterium]